MANIKLRIEVNPNAETETLGTIINEINNIGTNENISNVSLKANSDGSYINTSNINKNGREMLSWANNGILKFNNDGYLSTNGITAGKLASESEPDMFVWGAVPATKKYSVKLTFLNANSLKDIVIYGDNISNQFPTIAIIDEMKTIYNDDTRWAINMETESDTHTIEFIEWNRANYNACLTNIMVMLRYFELNKGWIDKIESLTQSTSDPSTIQYGLLANNGLTDLRDLDGELQDLIIDNIISNSNVPIEIFVNGNKIQTHITQESEYNKENKLLSLQLTNKLNNLDKVIFNGIKLSDSKNLYELFYEIMENLGYQTDEIDLMLAKEIVYGDNLIGSIKNYMEQINIQYPYLESSTYRDAINKICQLAQLQLFIDEDDKIFLINARPIATKNEINNAINIPKFLQINNIKESIILKNKYDKINTRFKSFLLNEPHEVATYNVIVYDDNGNFVAKDYTINKEFIDVGLYTYGTAISGNGDMSIVVNAPNKLKPNIPNLSPKFIDNTISCKIKKTFTGGSSQEFSLNEGTGFSSPLDEMFLYSYTTDGLNIASFNFNVTVRWEDLWGGLISKQKVASFTISLFAKQYSFEENEISYGNGSNAFDLTTNELFQDTTTYNTEAIYKIISKNILSDYKNGVSHATNDIFCADLYSNDGKLQKDWSKGEIINIGDIIYFDNDLNVDKTQRYWRVTGRNFKYSGSPILGLELQEIIKIY